METIKDLPKQKPEDLIREALVEAKNRGIYICRTAIYEWHNKNKLVPFACDAFGALFLKHQPQQLPFYKGWYKDLQNILGVDEFWCHRFMLGFDRLFQVELFTEKNGIIISRTQDSISKMAKALSKEFVTPANEVILK